MTTTDNRDGGAPPASFVLGLTQDSDYLPILTGPPQTAGMRSGRVRLEPGRRCGRHSTGAHEETLVILEGSGWVELEGRRALELAAPAAVYIPPRTEHDVVAGGPEPLTYVYVVAPIQS